MFKEAVELLWAEIKILFSSTMHRLRLKFMTLQTNWMIDPCVAIEERRDMVISRWLLPRLLIPP